MTLAFTHTGLSSRVVFGMGTLTRLREEVERLDLHRVLVVTTPQQGDHGRRIADVLGSRAHSVYAEAVMHVPDDVATRAVEFARAENVDGCLVVGGGSSIGLGKVIARDLGLPVVAVPTTYAGSEMTPVWGQTGPGGKRTGRDPRVLPVTVVYDVELTLTLPLEMSVTSAINALAHAVEALYAPDGSPLVDLMATEAVRSLLEAFAPLVANPLDPVARTQLLYGTWLAGSCLGATTMSLHHKLCHIVGGSFDLDHAWTHTVLLPHVMAFNLRPDTSAYDHVAPLLGPQPGQALFDLLREHGYTRSLADLGMPDEGSRLVVEQATSSPYANPFPVSPTDVARLVDNARCGRRPEVWSSAGAVVNPGRGTQ